MRMTAGGLLQIVRSWLWLIALVGVIPPLILGVRLKPTYSAVARVQLTSPPSVEVVLFEQVDPYRNLRDELTVARTNFIEGARSPEVRARTAAALGLQDPTAGYVLDVRQVRDSDFIDLSVESPSASMAEQIANTHAAVAIRYVAELRAMPAHAAQDFLATELPRARERLDAAQSQANQAPGSAEAQQILSRSRDQYLLVQRKLEEADIKSSADYTVRSMQIVSPAVVPTQADGRRVQIQLLMAAAGSLVIGVLIAVLLEAVSRTRMVRQPRPLGNPSHL